jgi:ATP-dependent Clp protease ATP-binding subunit ClpA
MTLKRNRNDSDDTDNKDNKDQNQRDQRHKIARFEEKGKEGHEENKQKNGPVVHVKEKSSKYYDYYECKIKSLEDFINIDSFYTSGNVNKHKSSNIQFATIHRLVPSIQKILKMVGLCDVKKQILEMIVFYLQRFDKGNQDYLHTVVYGGPGVGKTALIQILAEIYAKLGVLKTSKVTSVKRADLIGQYLGHTAAKTKKVIEEALGGILLIDEAYSLGDTEQRDSFSRECIDTLNQYLSEHKGEFICIIAGYKEDLDLRFFKSNPGLERRFPFRIQINDYKSEDLRRIFLSIVGAQGWNISDVEAPVELFEKHMPYFRFNGGDMETLFTRVKFIHSMRVFGDDPAKRKHIMKEDLIAGLKTFTSMDHVKDRKKDDDFISHLYM